MNAERKLILTARVEAINKEFQFGNQRKAFDALCCVVFELIREVQTPAVFMPQESQPIIEEPAEITEITKPLKKKKPERETKMSDLEKECAKRTGSGVV